MYTVKAKYREEQKRNLPTAESSERENKIRAELLCFIEACTLRGRLSGKRGHSMLSKVG